MFVSVTRLRLRSWFLLPSFLLLNERVRKQLERSAGYRGGSELMDKGLVFWTLTGWESEKDMKAFRGSDAHAEGMRKLPGWCNEAAVAHWVQESTELPTFHEAHRRLVESGRPSRVERPNENHTGRIYRPLPEGMRRARVMNPKT
jgi:hypothetical protein